MVKRLQSRKKEQYFLHTDIVRNREDAINEKAKLMHGSIFGKPLIKFEIIAMRDVWVPYCYLVYHFELGGRGPFKKGGVVRDGKVAVVFDLNEVHPVQYDIYENGDIKLVNKKSREDREIMKANIFDKDILEQTEKHIQMRIMKRFYGKSGDLKLVTKQYFFRPAVEMDIVYKKSDTINKRYAYLDEFGIQSEHILGLKYRVEHKS